MKYGNNKYEDIKIAYIGGGSRGWAWGFMSDLAVCEDMCGTVYLYDIDLEAAKKNEKIGNGIKDIEGCKSQWKYKAVETMFLTLPMWMIKSLQKQLKKECLRKKSPNVTLQNAKKTWQI